MKTRLILLCMCVSSSAFALGWGHGRGQSDDRGQVIEPAPEIMGFDDVRIACQNPARFHNQVAPSNIQISCQDLQYKWVPDADGAFTMGNSRMVTTSVTTDKLSIAPQSGAVACQPQVVACARFKEVAETVEVVRAVTCDEIIAFTGTALDYCASAANSLRAANQEAISVVDTGRVISLCGDGREERGQRGQH